MNQTVTWFYDKWIWLVKPVLGRYKQPSVLLRCRRCVWQAVLLTSVLQVVVVLLILHRQVCLAAKSAQSQQARASARHRGESGRLQAWRVWGQLDRGAVGRVRKVLSLKLLLLQTNTDRQRTSGSAGKWIHEWPHSTRALETTFSSRPNRLCIIAAWQWLPTCWSSSFTVWGEKTDSVHRCRRSVWISSGSKC